MSRTHGRIAGVLVALALAFSLTAVVAGPSNARPTPLRVDGATHRLLGGCVHNQRTHVLLCVIGTHKYYRKVKIHGRWTKHAFWGARVSTQHCKKTCWGRAREWTMPSRYRYGKPVGSSRDMVMAASGDCPMSLFGVSPMCMVPWSWFNHDVNKATQAVVNTVVSPCAKGSLLGFGGVAAANIWTKIFLEDGLVTKAAAASRFEGPAGYAIATAATCTVAVANRGGAHLADLFN
jgi:hypothetical protein